MRPATMNGVRQGIDNGEIDIPQTGTEWLGLALWRTRQHVDSDENDVAGQRMMLQDRVCAVQDGSSVVRWAVHSAGFCRVEQFRYKLIRNRCNDHLTRRV
jgi:hypothetical protein